MQGLEVRVVALGKKLRSVALEYGFDLNEAGLIVHEACLYILRDLPDVAQPIADVEDADYQAEASSSPCQVREQVRARNGSSAHH